MQASPRVGRQRYLLIVLTSCCVSGVGGLHPYAAVNPWVLVWSDEFGRAAGSGADIAEWLYDVGTAYPGGPAQWGTGEVETMTTSTRNVVHDGAGHLLITPVHDGSSPTLGWTSGRVETARTFDAPANGAIAFEASIKQPDVSGRAAAGYWPAFWSLGSPFRGNYQNWPAIGEIDMMEDVNGLSSEFATLHCGSAPGGPCNEFTGLSSGRLACGGCQTALHRYRVELDRGVSPQELRWFLDDTQVFSVKATRVDGATWANATNHPFFVLLDVAIGGGFPAAFGGGPTTATASGVSMVVDYVRVFKRAGAFSDDPLIPGVTPVRAMHVSELRNRINAVRGRFGVAAYNWTDPDLTAAPIKAIHITELRAAITDAYTAATLAPPIFSDPALAGMPIKAVHIAELRNATVSLETK